MRSGGVISTLRLRGIKVVSEKSDELLVEYEQTIEVKRGSLPFSSAIVQTKLVRDGARWGIYSTNFVRVIP